MKGQLTVTLSSEPVVLAVQRWCDRRLMGRSKTLGMSFYLFARLCESSRVRAIDEYWAWVERGCPLDDIEGGMPEITLPGEGQDAGGGVVRRASDAATRSKSARSGRRRKGG